MGMCVCVCVCVCVCDKDVIKHLQSITAVQPLNNRECLKLAGLRRWLV